MPLFCLLRAVWPGIGPAVCELRRRVIRALDLLHIVWARGGWGGGDGVSVLVGLFGGATGTYPGVVFPAACCSWCLVLTYFRGFGFGAGPFSL